MRNDDDGHGSPPPVLVFQCRRCDRNVLAGDVVQDVDFVCQRLAGEDFEDFQRVFQSRVGPLLHQRLDIAARQSRHRSLPKVADSVYHLSASGKAPSRDQLIRRSFALAFGGTTSRSDGVRSSGGMNEYGGQGPVGTTATSTAWE